jgi:hypothetical protein
VSRSACLVVPAATGPYGEPAATEAELEISAVATKWQVT